MQNVFPCLRITDGAKARAFYVDTLGFQIDWEYRHEPGFPVFMQISRPDDGLALYLSEHTGDAQPGGAVYLYVADVDAWHEQLKTSAGEISQPPIDQPWGNREMVVTDPAGNRIVIATPPALQVAAASAPGAEPE